MINFRDRHLVLPSALILASLVILAGTLIFMLLVPPPSIAGMAAGRSRSVSQLNHDITMAKSREIEARTAVAPRVWQGEPNGVSATILAQLNAQARQHTLNLSAFRPQRTNDLGGVTELPFTVQISGAYPGIRAVMAALDAPKSKIVLQSVQITQAQTSSTDVSATLGISAYLQSDPSLTAPPASTPKKSPGKVGSHA